MKWLSSMVVDPIRDLMHRKDRFSRGVMAILFGTVTSRVIAFATIPILSRLFTPSEFGVFALFSMVTAVLGSVVTWRYEASIILPESEESAINLLLVSCTATTISSVLCWVVFYIWGQPIAEFIGTAELGPWLVWSPLCIWAIGIFTSLRLWKSRQDDFASISYARVGDTSALSATQLSLGFAYPGQVMGLMLGAFVARFTAVIMLGYSTIKADGARIKQAVSWSKAKEQAKRYIRFPLYDLPASALNNFSREMPVAMLGVFFIPQWVGLYSMANRVMSVPLQVLGGSIAQVYLPVARDAAQSNRLDVFTLSIFDRLLRISVTPMLLVAIAAPELMSIVLGDQWYFAGVFLRWICPWLMLAFIASPISEVFSILERQNEKLMFNTVLFIVRFVSLLVGGLFGDAFLAVALFGVSGAIFWFVQCYWLIRISGVQMSLFWKHIGLELARALPFVAVMGAAQWYHYDFKKVVICLVILLSVYLLHNWRHLLSSGKAVQLQARAAQEG